MGAAGLVEGGRQRIVLRDPTRCSESPKGSRNPFRRSQVRAGGA